MKHQDLKKLYLKHDFKLGDYLTEADDDELFDTYNELNEAYRTDLTSKDLEIYDEIVDIVNEELSYRWVKAYRKSHNLLPKEDL